MSASMKDRKAVIYAEVETLRALLDQQQGQIAMQAETIRRRDDEIAALRSQLEERKAKSARPAPVEEDREVTISKMEIGRRLAILMKRTVRPATDGKFESYVDGEWIVIPERVVRHAAGAA